MSKAYSPNNILEKKFNVLEFEGEWNSLIGNPELKGSWIIWGNSGNGKTDFCIKLAKYFCKFGKVIYNPLEEGISESFKLALSRNKMHEEEGKLIILNQESITDLITRLTIRKAPKVAIIDSFQYTQLTKRTYIELKKRLPNTLLIWVSHAEGKNPEGRSAKYLKYDSNVKIHVEGFTAHCTSRYGGGKPYTIWKEKAEEFYASIKN